MSTRCITPFYKKQELVKGVTTNYMPLPCGRCPNCIKRRAMSWMYRMEKESARSESAHFITLTYSEENVPKTKKGLLTLKKKDVQDFIKRLRKKETKKVTYYAVGEYGSTTKRPHYHIIIYNASTQNITDSWKINGLDIGHIYFGDVTNGSVAYTLKYIQKEYKSRKEYERVAETTTYKRGEKKGLTKTGLVIYLDNEGKEKEFQIMSKGIGSNYITKEMINWHKKDILNRAYIPLKDGKKIAMPRYYKDKIYKEMDKKRIGHFMRLKTDEIEKELMENYKEGYYKEQADLHTHLFKKMYKKQKQNEKL